MRVVRVVLPGAATVAVARDRGVILVEQSLNRDEAALAIQSLLPGMHSDVIDHWLDRAYPRARSAFTSRQFVAWSGIALCVCALGVRAMPLGQPLRRPMVVEQFVPRR